MKIHPDAANLVTNEQKYQALYMKTWLRAGRSGDRIPVEERFSAPVQTSPRAYPASYTMGTGSIPGLKSGRDVTVTPHPLLVPWSRKIRAIPLLREWAERPVQSLSACTRVHFIFLPYMTSQARCVVSGHINSP